jgi:hypothetical protein
MSEHIQTREEWLLAHSHCGPHTGCCEECCVGCEANPETDGPHWYDLDKTDPRYTPFEP